MTLIKLLAEACKRCIPAIRAGVGGPPCVARRYLRREARSVLLAKCNHNDQGSRLDLSSEERSNLYYFPVDLDWTFLRKKGPICTTSLSIWIGPFFRERSNLHFEPEGYKSLSPKHRWQVATNLLRAACHF